MSLERGMDFKEEQDSDLWDALQYAIKEGHMSEDVALELWEDKKLGFDWLKQDIPTREDA